MLGSCCETDEGNNAESMYSHKLCYQVTVVSGSHALVRKTLFHNSTFSCYTSIVLNMHMNTVHTNSTQSLLQPTFYPAPSTHSCTNCVQSSMRKCSVTTFSISRLLSFPETVVIKSVKSTSVSAIDFWNQ